MCAMEFKHKHPVLIVIVLKQLLMDTQSEVFHESNNLVRCFPFDSGKKLSFYPIEISLTESFNCSELCSMRNGFCLCTYITLILHAHEYITLILHAHEYITLILHAHVYITLILHAHEYITLILHAHEYITLILHALEYITLILLAHEYITLILRAHRIVFVVLAKHETAPWRWFLREPKHVGTIVGILIVLISLWFYNCVHQFGVIK